jgi:hypothetical protein
MNSVMVLSSRSLGLQDNVNPAYPCNNSHLSANCAKDTLGETVSEVFMRLTVFLPMIAVASTLSAAPAAFAQTMIDATNIDEIVNIARGYGSATIQLDTLGDPQILGRIDGIQYTVNFYDCENGENCKSIQFRAAWTNPGTVTLEDMNRWNQDKRFGKAYLDMENDPVIEWDVNLFAGVSSRNLDDTFDWWKIVLQNFSADTF